MEIAFLREADCSSAMGTECTLYVHLTLKLSKAINIQKSTGWDPLLGNSVGDTAKISLAGRCLLSEFGFTHLCLQEKIRGKARQN